MFTDTCNDQDQSLTYLKTYLTEIDFFFKDYFHAKILSGQWQLGNQKE